MRRWVVVAIVLAVSTVGVGCSIGGGSEAASGSESAAPALTYLYGEDGPAPPGGRPERCPPPLAGTIPGYHLPDDWFDVYPGELGATACYGRRGPYRSCGDGIGDVPGQTGVVGGDDCRSEQVTGLPFAVPRAARAADAATVFSGFCLESADGDDLVLTDCRLPHVGFVIWGRAIAKPGQSLQGVCDANATSFRRFGAVRMVRSGDRFACIVVERAEG